MKIDQELTLSDLEGGGRVGSSPQRFFLPNFGQG